MEFTNHGRDRFFISDQEASDGRPSPSGPSSSSSFSAPFRRNDGGGSRCFLEKELMFDKVVTPSDVGKLNRLVIPKQHAEKHFPLDAGACRSGLLLSFEDRNGESWRFRYSYWSSSQSYVMTKGWSRFVKEKRLGAGDTVSFARGVGESGRDRLYIDWKRRPEIRRRDMPGFPLQYPGTLSFSRPWGSGHFFMPPPPQPPPPLLYDHQFREYGYSVGSQTTGQLIFFQSPATGQQPVQLQPRLPQVTASRGVRLFGVNLASRDGEGDDDAAAACSGERTSLSLSRSQGSSILLRPLQHSSVDCSMASSSSTSKEQHFSLDLDL